MRKTSRGAKRHCVAHGKCGGRDTLCDVRAVLPLRKDTSLHGGDPRAEDRKSRDRFKRSESLGSRKRRGDLKSSGSPGGRGLYAGGMRCVKSGILPLHHKENAICGHEICHDGGRKDRCADRRLQVDHGRKRKEKGAGAAPPVYGDHGWDRHGPGRRSNVKRPDPRAEESGADHLRQWAQDPDGFTDREDGKGVPDHRSVCGGAFRGRL